MSVPADTFLPLSSPPLTNSVGYTNIDDSAKAMLKSAAGDHIELKL